MKLYPSLDEGDLTLSNGIVAKVSCRRESKREREGAAQLSLTVKFIESGYGEDEEEKKMFEVIFPFFRIYSFVCQKGLGITY